MKQYRIYVTGKKGIFDPAGEQAHRALDSLGFEVEGVRIGKFIQLDCEDSVDREAVAKMCDKLLANPVIEDYRIEEA